MSGLDDWLVANHRGLWTIAVGAVSNASCAVLGCYLVLRRQSLLGDAISHAILPGILGAYLLTGQLSSLPVFVGAMACGVLTAFLTQSLHDAGRVPEDASMGVVFTSLFALGVFMISNYAGRIHLDADCALYGMLDVVALDTFPWGGFEIPRVFVPMLGIVLLTLVFVALLWKELLVASFDPALATAMGLRAGLVHYLMMGMVAAATVASFEAVGSVLVIAMLIVPAATAHLLTDRLLPMIVVAVGCGVLSAVLGYLGASRFDTNAAGMMTVAAGAQFTLALVFAPRHGLAAKAWQRWLLARRIVAEDLIALLFRTEELSSTLVDAQPLMRASCLQAVGGGWTAWFALQRLIRDGSVTLDRGRLLLTEPGRRFAQSLVRSHRLWEAFLVKHFHLPLDHLHAPAERIEHFIGPRLQESLASELSAELDPHGREIPPPVDGA